MLIQGSPDMLTPPRTPTLSGLGVFSGAAQTDPYWNSRVGSVQYLWNGTGNPWDKVRNLNIWASQWGWTVNDLAEAAGVDVETMRSFLSGPQTQADWEQTQVLSELADVYASATWAAFQKALFIRTQVENYGLSLDRVASALGLTVDDLQSFLYATEERYRKPLQQLFAASWLDAPRVGAALRDFARGNNLAADDLARLTGMSLTAVNRLLSVASPASAPGVNVIAQATPSSPGLVAIAGSDAWAIIPAGSDQVTGSMWDLTIRTTSGYQVKLPQGPALVRVPINSRGTGAIASVMANQNLTLADKARAVAEIQSEFGASDEEMQYWGADVGGLTYAQFIAAGTATYAAYTPDQIAFGPRSITNNEDAELWDLFYGIWNDASLTLDQRIDRVVDAMIAMDVGLYDLGRITGFDATAWQQTLGVDADFLESRVVPVVVAPNLIDAAFTVAQTSVFETASPASQAAQGPGGVGILTLHDNIRNFIAEAGTDYRAVVDGMQTWGVSLDDIKAALFDTPGSAVWIAGLVDFINPPRMIATPPPVVQVATEVSTTVEDLEKMPVVVVDDSGVRTGTATRADAVDTVRTATDTRTDTRSDTRNDTTTGAPAMIQLPANLGTMTEAQKIAWYRATLAAGNSDAAIRAAVEARYGRQSDSDWTYLRAKAAQAAPAGGGAGLLIAAAAAYFLLG